MNAHPRNSLIQAGLINERFFFRVSKVGIVLLEQPSIEFYKLFEPINWLSQNFTLLPTNSQRLIYVSNIPLNFNGQIRHVILKRKRPIASKDNAEIYAMGSVLNEIRVTKALVQLLGHFQETKAGKELMFFNNGRCKFELRFRIEEIIGAGIHLQGDNPTDRFTIFLMANGRDGWEFDLNADAPMEGETNFSWTEYFIKEQIVSFMGSFKRYAEAMGIILNDFTYYQIIWNYDSEKEIVDVTLMDSDRHYFTAVK